jgi:hypothetical protein
VFFFPYKKLDRYCRYANGILAGRRFDFAPIDRLDGLPLEVSLLDEQFLLYTEHSFNRD